MTRTDPTDVPRPDARLHFGVFFQGVNHWTIWSDPASGSQIDPSSFLKVARTAERGLFDAFFLGDGLRLRESEGGIHELDVAGRPDSITQLSALAAATERIGLVSTSNTTFNEPGDLARRLAGLDLLSGGRAGWNIVTTHNAWTGENFRRGGYLDHADRYRRAEEFLSVARAVWDGWADGAVAGSAEARAWSVPDAVGRVRRRGAQFDVDLAPTLPRSAQGHPVIFQAGDSGEGRDFAARHADVIFSAHGRDFDDALAFADDLRRRLRAVGRAEDALRVLPGTEIVIGATEKEAEEKARWVRLSQVTPAVALGIASRLWGIDLSERDAEGPLPAEDPVTTAHTGKFGTRWVSDPHPVVAEWRAKAEANRWSLRETVIELGPQHGHVGTPAGLAERFGRFVRHGALDGFNISPYLVPDGLDDIVDLLVPALQERGLYRTAYTGSTLREHLELAPVG
ncbi:MULTISPECIES: NtaA/DmoA family FMN-dependent monooxygenase [unclassified Streptomyces]|uniref:NtaA/DmoA family FMN-dependent monooxygenase n=1 Tax=unclassified Streptomyces TaxID=2593676 RepID=UPI00166110BB|nr:MULTISPECIES: NtaA/DmoA family FMN-dependent monooxygenase [unclassified Streptomyces]MBD0708822.1 F420-dependent methylene-tetrahydromethanopterin reductase [Streptomyces sp. CBMA291]MBD0717044.1 F420-dependent methylene-tetrahydromethanopterin reductase [Streptomyces sp. CBMA370]